MNAITLDSLLSGKRKQWFRVSWGVVFTAILVVPGIDASIQQYGTLGKMRAVVAARAELPERTTKLGGRVAETRSGMEGMEAVLVPADNLMAFKQEITGSARKAQCRVTSIRPGTTTRRPFDEVIGKRPAPPKPEAKEMRWTVEEQVSVVSVQGAFPNLVRFLAALDSDSKLLDLAALELHAPPEGAAELILDLHIKTFSLISGGKG